MVILLLYFIYFVDVCCYRNSEEETDNLGKVEARMKELETDLKSLDEQIATAEVEMAKVCGR